MAANGSPEAFAAGLPFALDPFQREALEALGGDRSVLVAAPTGSGKTVVAEYACWLAVRTGVKCFYTTPLKALSNQKFGDLIARHGAQAVGLLTGDNSINGEAPLVVMTTEVLRNMLYERSPTLRGLGYVILDEVHYLQDPYRGAVWEEVLIHLPGEVRVVCLSATVSNLEEFGGWLRELRGRVDVVVSRERPVELRNHVLLSEDLYPLLDPEDPTRPSRNLERAWSRAVASSARAGPRGRQRSDRRSVVSRPELAEILDRRGMLPAIVFVFSRIGCDRAVEACVLSGVRLTTDAEADKISEYAHIRTAALPSDDLQALGFASFLDGLERGVSSHHAGMLPAFKETVEELFAMGLVKLVFATETLSLGINMPARTVVIERLSKFTGERHELLTPMDYTQLTGRAGRRGIDTLGHAVVLFDAWVPLDKIATLATVRSYPLTSSFRPSYNMAVNLVRTYDPESAVRMLNSSFAQYAADRDVVTAERKLVTQERSVAELREEASCERGDVVSYARLRAEAEEAMSAERGGAEVREAFGRLTPGDVVVGDRLGRALVLEQPRLAGGTVPRITVMTTDRKLRRITARDFRTPPVVVGKVPVRGQSWRSPKVRRDLLRGLYSLDVGRPKPAPTKAATRALVDAYTGHPVHSCPDVDSHMRAAEKLKRAEAQAASLRKRVRRRRDTLARTFERVLNVLRALDYVDDWSLTPKGEMLARVYNPSDLLLVECITRGWLSGLDPEELAAMVSLFTYESRGRDEPESAPSPHLGRYHRRITNLYRSLHEIEQREGAELLAEPDGGFMAVVHEWAGGASLDEVLSDRELSAGDFVRSTKQVVDLLQQLRQVVEGEELSVTLGEAVATVQRGVVAYSGVV